MDKQATCTDIINDVEGVKTFVFESSTEFPYLSGQFITLAIPIESGDIFRSYTLSSAPTNAKIFTITVRAVNGGIGSHWLHHMLKPGMTISFSGAYGKFIPAQYDNRKLLLLAAGSGITPHISTLRHWRNQATKVNAHLIFSVRNPEQIIEQYELLSLVKQINGLTMTIIPEDITASVWHGISGQLDPLWLDSIIRDIDSREVFVCGPSAYMRAVKSYLSSKQFDLSHYHEEAFNSPPDTKQKPPLKADTPTYQIRFHQSDINITSQGHENLLELAEKAGVKVKSACRSGICGSCRVLNKAGSVDMQDLGGILPNEVSQNMVLLCCSKPTSDLVLDI